MVDFILRFISDYAPWIYIICGLGALWVLRSIQGARDEQQAALFSLERESATNRLTQGIRFLVAILALAGVTTAIDFSSTTPASLPPPQGTVPHPPIILPTPIPPTPSPTSGPPTPTPTLPPRPTETPAEPSPTPTPAYVAPSCPDPHAVITAPGEGQTISGLVEIRGTAYSESKFREYQIFYAAGENPNEKQWAWDYSSSQQISNGLLHTWDPQGRNGVFTFILRVVKTDSNWFEPCQVTVNVL